MKKKKIFICNNCGKNILFQFLLNMRLFCMSIRCKKCGEVVKIPSACNWAFGINILPLVILLFYNVSTLLFIAVVVLGLIISMLVYLLIYIICKKTGK